jgi:hypothetical protein
LAKGTLRQGRDDRYNRDDAQPHKEMRPHALLTPNTCAVIDIAIAASGIGTAVNTVSV